MYRAFLLVVLLVFQSCIATVVDRVHKGEDGPNMSLDSESSCRYVDLNDLASSVELDLSYYYSNNQTAAASLGMILAYHQNNKLTNSLNNIVESATKDFAPDDDKASVYDIMVEAENNGYTAGIAMCSINNLLDTLNQKIPVILRILRNDGVHAEYVVATGYNMSLKQVFINDPLDINRESISFDELKTLWKVNSLDTENNTEDLMIIIR